MMDEETVNRNKESNHRRIKRDLSDTNPFQTKPGGLRYNRDKCKDRDRRMGDADDPP